VWSTDFSGGLGWRANHVKGLISWCLQNLCGCCKFIFGRLQSGTLSPFPPLPHECAQLQYGQSVCSGFSLAIVSAVMRQKFPPVLQGESEEIANKMQPYNRIYYSTVHWRLDMFRAAYRSSSGALNCICSLRFIYTCGDRP